MILHNLVKNPQETRFKQPSSSQQIPKQQQQQPRSSVTIKHTWPNNCPVVFTAWSAEGWGSCPHGDVPIMSGKNVTVEIQN
jgi:hypothetical protein